MLTLHRVFVKQLDQCWHHSYWDLRGCNYHNCWSGSAHKKKSISVLSVRQRDVLFLKGRPQAFSAILKCRFCSHYLMS